MSIDIAAITSVSFMPLKTGFSAFHHSSDFTAKRILPHATQNLQVINIGMYSRTYIYICILKIQKL